MISVGIGSAGEGNPSYAVRLPFTISPGRTLKLADGGRFDMLGRMCEITQEREQYVLTVCGFDTEETASTFLAKVSAGLIWFGLRNSIGFKFNPVPTPVELYDKPKPITESQMTAPMVSKGWREVDGHYDADKTIIIPDHKRLVVFGLGSVSVRLDMPVSLLSEAMLEGIGEGRPELVPNNAKLWLACEVYLSSHFENSSTASFLSRITTLEILVEDVPASEPVRTMAERFIDEAKTAQKVTSDQGIQREFESLVSRLAYLRNRSIKSGVRTLVERTLQTEMGKDEAGKVAREISKLYDLRSTLVHSGRVDANDIVEGNNRLNEVVPSILKVLFRETAQRD